MKIENMTLTDLLPVIFTIQLRHSEYTTTFRICESQQISEVIFQSFRQVYNEEITVKNLA